MGAELKTAFWRGLVLFCVLEAMLVPAVLYWPEFKEVLPLVVKLAPSAVLKQLFGGLQLNADGGAAGYVLGQQYFKACNTMGVAAAALFGMGAIAGEAQRGTLEIWLMRPVPRRRLLFERWLAGALSIAVPVFLSSATIPPLGRRIGENFSQLSLAWCSAYQCLFLVALYTLTVFLSTVSSHPVRIAVFVLFGSILQFALYLVQNLTNYSLFRLVDVTRFGRVYSEQRFEWAFATPLLVLLVGSLLGAMIAIRRRTP